MTITTKQEKPSEIVLKVEKLRKEFGGIVAVKEVSFEIKKGELYQRPFKSNFWKC
jgi:ABC-type uncharacterized transport system ATPase subunit